MASRRQRRLERRGALSDTEKLRYNGPALTNSLTSVNGAMMTNARTLNGEDGGQQQDDVHCINASNYRRYRKKSWDAAARDADDESFADNSGRSYRKSPAHLFGNSKPKLNKKSLSLGENVGDDGKGGVDAEDIIKAYQALLQQFEVEE